MRRGGMGSGSFGMSVSKDLPLSKEEYYELLELLVIYIWLPSKGYEDTVHSMKELPMPPKVRSAFEQRLIDIKNTVVADLKISNAELVRPKQDIMQEEVKSLSEQGQNEKSTSSQMKNREEKIKNKKTYSEKNIKRGLITVAILLIIFSLIKSGLAKRLILTIIKSRLVRWLLLMIFNYRLSTKKS